MRIKNCSCSSVSTPSATTSSPSVRARALTVAQISRSFTSTTMSRTNTLSIFSSLTGRRLSLMSDEWPVPKSSIDSAKPAFFSSSAMAYSDSSSSCDSVISSTRLAGVTPARWVTPSRVWVKPGSRSWMVETLTDTTGICQPSARHCAIWWQAVSNTHSPMGTMSPLSSASGMNSSGGTALPSTDQRSSASAPTVWRCWLSWGW